MTACDRSVGVPTVARETREPASRMAADSLQHNAPDARLGWGARVRRALPEGQTLPEDVFERRHRWILALLWAHAIILPLVGALAGYPLLHNLGHAVPIFVCGVLGGRRWARRRTRAVLVSVGLLTCSALLVHIEHGLIEMHFHFFVMISVLTLYEDWLPFL